MSRQYLSNNKTITDNEQTLFMQTLEDKGNQGKRHKQGTLRFEAQRGYDGCCGSWLSAAEVAFFGLAKGMLEPVGFDSSAPPPSEAAM